MKRRTPAAERHLTVAIPLVVLLSGLLLSVLAGWSAWRFWQRLPRQSVRHLQTEDIRAAFDRARRNAPADVREALALHRASEALADAFTHKIEPQRLQRTIADASAVVSRSQLGRLQQAAAHMWLLEQTGTPMTDWWPVLRPFLGGLVDADFAHHQPVLIQCWAEAYESLGVGAGTAYGLANDLFGQSHGPFLQFFVDRLQRVANEREQAGDLAAAANCRGLLRSLLKQWVLEPGPAGLRLLASDLLADILEPGGVTDANGQAWALAHDMRAWRAAYHEAARQRPTATLAPARKPALAPAAHKRLLHRFALTTWMGSATTTAGIVALALAWAWLGPRRTTTRARSTILLALAVAAIVAATGWGWVRLWPESVRTDLRGDFSRLCYWWRHPFVAAGLTLILLFVGGRLQRRTPNGRPYLLPHLGALAAATWLLLAITFGAGVVAGEVARRNYENATRAAYDDSIGALTGSEAERWLDRLRRWEP